MPKDVIIALDFPTASECFSFLDRFGEIKPYVKVGMELFYAEGPSIIKQLKERGHKIFLDLKLHDIPNTVEHAMSVLSKLDVDMTNLHAAGTKKMMAAGLRGLTRADGTRPLLISITQLTSTNQEQMQTDLLIEKELEDVVLHYAKNTKEAGLDGIVCSPWESPIVHQKVSNNFLTITPGVRFADDAKGDQARVATPAKARELGSDYIVVGRSITGAVDPVDAYRRACRDFLNTEI